MSLIEKLRKCVSRVEYPRDTSKEQNMHIIYHFCQGESHKSSDKECQDYSCGEYDQKTQATIAVVCDGHGGETYFRSAVGAKCAAETAIATIKEFLQDFEPTKLNGNSLVQVGVCGSESAQDIVQDEIMRRLFSAIHVKWLKAIKEDGLRPLTEWEREHVKEEYWSLLSDEEKIVKAYGCTLMAYVQAPAFWLAFHIGDGKCVMVNSDYTVSQPIPWDDKCFLNRTTSMCDLEPSKNFRYCYCADGTFPVAVFLGSDGLDDTFGDGDKLHRYYCGILKAIAKEGKDAVQRSLEETLPIISKKGSRDDMSVAVVYDSNRIDEASAAMSRYQSDTLEQEIMQLEQQIQSRVAHAETLHDKFRQVEKFVIEHRMEEKEIQRERQKLEELKDQLSRLENPEIE